MIKIKALAASLAALAAVTLTGAPAFAHSVPASASSASKATAATANPSVKLGVFPPQPGMGGPYSSFQLFGSTAGISHPEYRFFIQLPSGRWVSGGHFHHASMFSFPADTQSPGKYLVVVDARSGLTGPIWSAEKTVTVHSSITVS